MERIKAAYESGTDSLEEYQTNKTMITDRIQKLREKLRLQSAEPAPTAMDISLSLPGLLSLLTRDILSESAKNELLKTIISHITFYRPENAIRIHYRT